nr:mesoderm induction early response protein 2-like isoform X2 [Manis javanica]
MHSWKREACLTTFSGSCGYTSLLPQKRASGSFVKAEQSGVDSTATSSEHSPVALLVVVCAPPSAAAPPGRCWLHPSGSDLRQTSRDMPLDELLALYGYEPSDPISERESEGSGPAAHLLDMTLDKEQIAKDLLSGEEEEETQSSADDLTPSVTSHEASDLFPSQSESCLLADADKEPGSSTSSDTEDPLPANKCKKEIMVGPQFQADLSHLHLNRHSEKSKWGLVMGEQRHETPHPPGRNLLLV